MSIRVTGQSYETETKLDLEIWDDTAYHWKLVSTSEGMAQGIRELLKSRQVVEVPTHSGKIEKYRRRKAQEKLRGT